ncbi:MAG: hypothetical protein JOZ90_01195 [Alphaproteobacteria bacterium]|nr:hypothetical protein [Alphaproteobacteria bacterium]MBV9372911.1 hypothetical protein [Alphaproteobacteria bacterium]MBV9899693.1 hypothetical protein [Alphaproteobacteria bacterium]
MRLSPVAPAAAAVLLALSGCKTSGVGDTVSSAGSAVTRGVSQGVPSLVNVDLKNVLNDLAVQLHLDRANVPINAQIPISLAVNVCGVSINILSVSNGRPANCTATTSSPELAQVVQQQLAAGGNVGGGAQGGSTATNGGAAGANGASTGTAQPMPAPPVGPSAPTPTVSTPAPLPPDGPAPAPTQNPPPQPQRR